MIKSVIEFVSYQRNSPGWQWEQLLRRLGESWDRFWQNLGNNTPSDLAPWLQWSMPEWLARGLFALIVGGLVGWLGWHLWKVLWPQWQRWQQQRSGRSTQATSAAAPQLSYRQWQDQAQLFQQQGDYRAACRALYFAFLQWLADRPAPEPIPPDPSRTDGEYGQLLTQNPKTSKRSQSPQNGLLLLQTHERLCFSDAALTEADYQACAQAYRQEIQDSTASRPKANVPSKKRRKS